MSIKIPDWLICEVAFSQNLAWHGEPCGHIYFAHTELAANRDTISRVAHRTRHIWNTSRPTHQDNIDVSRDVMRETLNWLRGLSEEERNRRLDTDR